MWIQREISHKINQILAQRPGIVVTGARQVGKSSLLKVLFPKFNYVTLDLPSIAAQAKYEPELFLKSHPAPLIIDEVQYAPELFRYLKIKIDENRDLNGQYVLTGSQRFQLMKEVSDSLAGRVHVMELEGLSMREILTETQEEVNYPELILRGGYPELYKTRNLSTSDFFSSYVASYLERDVKDILQVSSLRDFERFLRLCAIRSSQMLNKSEIARDTGISASTAGEWISVLETSGIIHLLEPWFSNKSKSIIKTPKLYFSDTGLLCFLLNIRTTSELISYPQIGALWETFVYSELRKRLSISGESRALYYWRDRIKEVDFLISRGGRIHIAEAKWTEKPHERDRIGLNHAVGFFGQHLIASQAIISRSKNDFREDNIQITSPQSFKGCV